MWKENNEFEEFLLESLSKMKQIDLFWLLFLKKKEKLEMF